MNRQRSLFKTLGKIEGLPIFLVLMALYLVLVVSAPTVFLHFGIYMSFLQSIPPTLIAALGLTLVITAGEIDLSFPAVVALSGLALSWSVKTFGPDAGILIGIVLALASGALVGYINGIIVARIHVPSIMATLAAQFFWYGITILLAGGLSVALKGIDGNFVQQLLVGQLFGTIPMQAIWSLALAAFLWFILNRHTFGEAITFIGDNPNVARVMGINVEATRIRLFTIHGMIAAFAGIIVTLYIGVFYPDQGNFLLPAMASVFVGGTSIAGGAGSVFGTLFGAYIIGSLEAGVVATTISGYWVQVITGLVMGAVVILNALISEGNLSSVSNRLRAWGVPIRTEDNTNNVPQDIPVKPPFS
ncbi:MAG TPA: ABC transporter permease [Aggregatilineales bacterium]|nr:ABC transporter permease [Aggregatilineales bacterium]